MTWGEELAVMLAAARGDLALYLALAALRKVENGRVGTGGAGGVADREMGVLDPAADTFEKQVHWARNTLVHYERDAAAQMDPGVTARDGETGLYTAAFLVYASHRYAPLGADNDPKDLNRAHSTNWRAIYARFAVQLLAAARTLT